MGLARGGRWHEPPPLGVPATSLRRGNALPTSLHDLLLLGATHRTDLVSVRAYLPLLAPRRGGALLFALAAAEAGKEAARL